ncbi:hypothetical protein D3C83_145380 [compost metagenome]
MPQVGLPHSEPEISAASVKAAPTGALHMARTSIMRMRHTSAMNPITAIAA